MRQNVNRLRETGIDAAAIKPAECDVLAAADLPFDTVVIDDEGPAHRPDEAALRTLAGAVDELRLTVPVRADGSDPLGDDARLQALPPGIGLVLVAGNPAYLTEAERRRAITPRLEAAVERARDPWVGTEGIERTARATGATQFLLLSPSTREALGDLRDDGFRGELAVYAPTVLADGGDDVLDAIGPYVARRRRVADSLPPGAAVDAGASGRTRSTLLAASEEYALVGTPEAIAGDVEALRRAGADRIVAYPAQGLSAFDVDG